MEALEAEGIIQLPPINTTMQKKGKGKAYIPKLDFNTNEIKGQTTEYETIRLTIAQSGHDLKRWRAYVNQYHMLGDKTVFGSRLQYFIKSGDLELGCIQFSASSWALEERDKWIGWTESDRKARLNLIVNNSRFLIFPWVHIRNRFPEFDSMQHAHTLARLLERIEVEQIQECLMELLQDLIRRKKFRNHLINRRYLVAVDGTQKFFRDYQWEPEALKRHVGGEERIPQYYVYALESVLILDNGIVLPVLTEILENKDWVEGQTKQDCESKAFYRLAGKLLKI